MKITVAVKQFANKICLGFVFYLFISAILYNFLQSVSRARFNEMHSTKFHYFMVIILFSVVKLVLFCTKTRLEEKINGRK